MWLRDSLPTDLKGVRVLVYGYDTKLAESKSFQDLEALASTFRRLLLLVRRNSTVELSSRPRFFISRFLTALYGTSYLAIP